MAEEAKASYVGFESAENIKNAEEYYAIYGNGGNDTITNTADHVSIIGGTGDDSIINSGKNVKFYLNKGDGNDTIHGFNSTSTLVVGSQYANLTTNGTDNFIKYTKGSTGEKVTLKDLKGGSMELWSTGTWSDTWVNYINGSGFRPGKGNDLAENYADNFIFRYDTGDGNDVVRGFKSNSTLSIDDGEGTYSAETVGSDVIVTVGDGNITLEGAASLDAVHIAGRNPLLITLTENADTYSNSLEGATILALAGNDSISNRGANVSIDLGAGNDTLRNGDSSGGPSDNTSISGGAGNDYIDNLGSEVTIDAGDGDDTIFSAKAYGWSSQPKNVTFDGGKGNDSLVSANANASLNGGEGNDTIELYEEKITATGGVGNDYFKLATYAYNNLIQYSSGDGNDTITGFDADDTLEIGGGTGTYSKATVGNDIVVTVGEEAEVWSARRLSKRSISRAMKSPPILCLSRSPRTPTLTTILLQARRFWLLPATIQFKMAAGGIILIIMAVKTS